MQQATPTTRLSATWYIWSVRLRLYGKGLAEFLRELGVIDGTPAGPAQQAPLTWQNMFTALTSPQMPLVVEQMIAARASGQLPQQPIPLGEQSQPGQGDSDQP